MKLASCMLLAVLATTNLVGCSNFRFPGVHKINIQQGHIITQEMVSQLKLGMTKRQVRFVLGNTLLPNTFNDDRWDYHYSLRKGAEGKMTAYLYTVYFDQDKLIKTEGSFLPEKAPVSKDKSEKYLDDMQRDMPLPSNSADMPPPELPEENL